jgi:hypothetical protein
MALLKQKLAVGVAALTLVGVGAAAIWQRRYDQRADPTFRPALAGDATPVAGHPRVAIDQAHHDGGTLDGRYAGFARIAEAGGFAVVPNTRPFAAGSLDGVGVLVIADALGARWSFLPGASRPAFTLAEEDALEAWVRGGGALLLVADANPAGAAAARLARRFGVDMRGGRAFDPAHADTTFGSPSWIVYSRDDNSVRSHPVTDGGGPERRVRRAVAFTGQSLGVPDGATALLALSATAKERLADGRDVSAAGRAQAVALRLGYGRVVVFGESAMLTALTTAGSPRLGVTWPGTDDERLTLNSVRWLAGVAR